jgi:hypothetical protein
MRFISKEDTIWETLSITEDYSKIELIAMYVCSLLNIDSNLGL